MSSSSSRWLQRQRRDKYVRDAKVAGYRSRAAFKLLEISRRTGMFRSVRRVVDLGAAPGGWSQVVSSILDPQSAVFAIDKLSMDSIPGVQFRKVDITDACFSEEMKVWVGVSSLDLVLSDIAPNLSGIASVDQASMSGLVMIAANFCEIYLKKGGNFLVKVFEGDELPRIKDRLRGEFSKITILKPKASRSDSAELYLWCCGRR